MTTYNTGNPLGSPDPRDLYDNAENLDEAVNSDAETWQDRLGTTRPTFKRLERDYPNAGFDADRAEAARDEAEAAASSAGSDADRAEAAAEAAASAGTIYPDSASGVSGTSPGEYFWVVSAADSRALELWRHDPGGVAFDTGKRTPSADLVFKPQEVGNANGWIDPFFRHLQINEHFSGRRWHSLSTGTTTLELVDNDVFIGRALRKVQSGTGELAGPLIRLSEMGAAEGDTITIRGLVVGNGAVVSFAGRFLDGNLELLGSQTTDPSVTASAVPQLCSISPVVPADAVYFLLYPFTVTSGETFDIVALWAGKGTADEVPVWPNYNDLDYLGAQLEEQARVGADLYTVYGPSYVAEYSSSSAEIEAPGFTLMSRGAPFAGWGTQYTTPGAISFNLIRIPSLTRSTPSSSADVWSTIRVEVRDADRNGRLLAYSEIVIPENVSPTGELEFPLLDPDSGNPITLTESDLGATFMVGYIAYNRHGGRAIAGECQGEAPEFAGAAYYYHQVQNTWRDYTANVAQAINLYFADGLTITRQMTARDAGDDPDPGTESVDLVVGPYLYQAPGREINIYWDNLLWQGSRDYLFDVACPVGRHFERRMRVNGTQPAGEHSLTITAHRPYDHAQVGEAISVFRVADAATGTGNSRNLLLVGDSLTAGGEVITEVVDLFSADAMNLTAIGTRGVAPYNHEGRGGWKVEDYTTAGRSFFEFTVAGVVEAPAINATDYAHNGSVYRVQEVYLDGNGDGTLICERRSGSNDPLASGALTKDNGAAGDATISFSAWANVAGNPFWNDVSGQIDFANYLSVNGFTMTAGDWVVINLGINDVFGQTSDGGVDAIAAVAFGRLDALAASIQSVDPGIRVGICITMPPTASQDGFGIDYLNGQTRWRFKRNILRWAQLLVDYFSGREGGNIYVLPLHCNYDTIYNSQHSNSPVNARNSETALFHTNGVHPAESGYLQMADSIFSAIKYHG